MFLWYHKLFGAALNAIQFLVWLKKFGPAQNILGPVEGQGISVSIQGAFNFLSSNNLPPFLKMILKASNLNLFLNSLLTSENTKYYYSSLMDPHSQIVFDEIQARERKSDENFVVDKFSVEKWRLQISFLFFRNNELISNFWAVPYKMPNLML